MTGTKSQHNQLWWPNKWVRIVWVIWMDHQQYRQRYRPLLLSGQAGKTVFIQATLGVILCCCVYLLFLIGISFLIDLDLVLVSILGLVPSVMIFISAILLERTTFYSELVTWFVPMQAVCGLSGFLGVGLVTVIYQSNIWSLSATGLIISGLAGIFMGLNANLVYGIVKGVVFTSKDSILLATLFAVFVSLLFADITNDLMTTFFVSMTTGVGIVLGLIIGGVWVIRQVENKKN